MSHPSYSFFSGELLSSFMKTLVKQCNTIRIFYCRTVLSNAHCSIVMAVSSCCPISSLRVYSNPTVIRKTPVIYIHLLSIRMSNWGLQIRYVCNLDIFSNTLCLPNVVKDIPSLSERLLSRDRTQVLCYSFLLCQGLYPFANLWTCISTNFTIGNLCLCVMCLCARTLVYKCLYCCKYFNYLLYQLYIIKSKLLLLSENIVILGK